MLKYYSKKLSDIGDIVTGKTPPTIDDANYGDGYMFVSPTELHDGFEITNSENTLENEQLVFLRDWLLPMLMNGQATISD